MDPGRPQVRVAHECLRRVAEDPLDLGRHVRDPATGREFSVGDVDVDRGRNALDEHPVPRVGVGLVEEGELQLVTGMARFAEQSATLMKEERLADAGEDDDPEGGGIVHPEAGVGQAIAEDQRRAPEQRDQRQCAKDGRRRTP